MCFTFSRRRLPGEPHLGLATGVIYRVFARFYGLVLRPSLPASGRGGGRGACGRGEVAWRRKTTLHQLERWLQPAAGGEKIVAFALWEPCCGSDAFSLEAEAGRRGGSWVINGTKLWITSDIYADAFHVAARTGPPEEKSQWMKECVETSPVTVMGVRGTGTAEVEFHDCEVGEVGMLLMGRRRVVSWVLKLAGDVYSNFIPVLSAYIDIM